MSDPDDCHHADVAGLHVFAMWFPGEYQWHAATDDGSAKEGEATTLDDAKAAAEEAALPMIVALIARRETELVELRKALP